MRFLALAIPVFIFFSNGSVSAPLTPDQKQRLKNLTESYAQLQKLTGSFLDTDRSKTPPLPTPPKDNLPPIDESSCEIDLPIDEFGELKAGEDMIVPTFSVEIKGDQCPVYIKGLIGGEQKGETAFTAVFEWIYIGKGGEYKNAFDIHEVSLKGTIAAELNQYPDGMGMKMTMKLDGQGVSKAEGPFVNTVSGEYEFNARGADQQRTSSKNILRDLFGAISNVEINGRFSQKFVLNFAEVNAEVEERTIIESIFSMRQEHYMNQELVTAEEYKEFMKDIQFPGMDTEKGGDPPSGGSAKEFAGVCQVNMYDKNVISKEEAEQRFRQHLPIMQPPLAFFNSCFGDSQQQSANGRSAQTNFSNNGDHMQVSLSFLNNQSQQPLEFFVLEEEDLALAESYDNTTVTIQCYSQQRCPK